MSRARTRGVVSTPAVGAAADPEAQDRQQRTWEAQLARESQQTSKRIEAAVGNSPTAGRSGKTISVQLSAGTVTVHHGLGRAPSGWQVVRLTGSVPVSFVETGANESTISFIATGAARLSLWVY